MSKYKSKFSLGVWYYNFTIYLNVLKKETYSALFFLVNDILPFTGKGYIRKGVFSYSLSVLYMVLKDLTVFSDKKTNLGLFNLKNPLSLRLFVSGGDAFVGRILLRNLKVKAF
jgi:hypothetical protein